jgi:hypothetical protein
VRSAKELSDVAHGHACGAISAGASPILGRKTEVNEIQEAFGQITNARKTSPESHFEVSLLGKPGSSATRQFADDLHFLLAVRRAVGPEDLVEPDRGLLQDIRSLP